MPPLNIEEMKRRRLKRDKQQNVVRKEEEEEVAAQVEAAKVGKATGDDAAPASSLPCILVLSTLLLNPHPLSFVHPPLLPFAVAGQHQWKNDNKKQNRRRLGRWRGMSERSRKR
jgi:hypothetical protein